jgi:hypothetical protein
MVSGGIGIVQFLAVIPAIIYIDTWGMASPTSPYEYSINLTLLLCLGRKPLLRGGSILMTLSHLSIAFLVGFFHLFLRSFYLRDDTQVYQYQDDWASHSTAAWGAVLYETILPFNRPS